MSFSVDSISLAELGSSSTIRNTSSQHEDQDNKDHDNNIGLDWLEDGNLETESHNTSVSACHDPRREAVESQEQMELGVRPAIARTITAGLTTQARSKRRKYMTIKECFNSIMTVIAVVTAAVYFYFQYQQTNSSNILALEETCRSHQHNNYVQSLPTCKASRLRGDFDLDRRSISNSSGLNSNLQRNYTQLYIAKSHPFKVVITKATATILDKLKWIVPKSNFVSGINFRTLGCKVAWFIIWYIRYAPVIVNSIAHWMYKPIPIPQKPSFTSGDVTVIIPTIHNDFLMLRDSLTSILSCHPYEILLVTPANKYHLLAKFAKTFGVSNITVFQAPIANKRIQLLEVIPLVKTEITIMVDDDVTWPRTIIPWLLAPFNDKGIGAVGPYQRAKRIRSGHPIMARIYNWLGAAYLQRYNFEASATVSIDGYTSCISGRTCAIRSEILQSPLFLHSFKTERWGIFQLNTDDANFITRWLVANNWKTWIQYNKECEIETTFENSALFLHQCLRWSRSNWRSNHSSIFTERHIWYQHPWSAYIMLIETFISGPHHEMLMFPLSIEATQDWTLPHQRYAIITQLVFILGTKVVKLAGLFIREPCDIIFLPISILFGIFYFPLRLWAGHSLRNTSWRSRPDGDVDDSARFIRCPRPSKCMTLPAGNHPSLIRYRKEVR